MKKKTERAFQFVIEELENSRIGDKVHVKPMFGAHAIYIDHKIVLILRKKIDSKTTRDNGIWVVTTPEYKEALQKAFPKLREVDHENIQLLGAPIYTNVKQNVVTRH